MLDEVPLILIDTSVWIDFYRGKNSPAAEDAARYIAADLAVLAAPVYLELLRGTKTIRERRLLENDRRVLKFTAPADSTWEHAGILGVALSGRGITIPTLDLLIAQIAIEHDFAVLTMDEHFPLIAARSKLILIPLRS